jgi:endonuclease/exonuclease/phosphatase (EEP) superfamily protein YafD
MPSEAPTPGFWRCLKCGTPNPSTLYLTSCVACGYPRPAPGFEARAEGREAKVEPARRIGRRPSALLSAVAGYGLLLIAAWFLQWGIRDDWWPGMVLYLSPRALFLVPLVPLALWAWRARRPRIAAAIAVEALFVSGPLMGFVVPWSRLWERAEGPTIRIMSFNRGGQRGIDEADFLRYIERHKVDVVCFQELGPAPTVDRVLVERGWHRDQTGSIVTRLPIVEEYPKSAEINEGGGNYTAILYRLRLRGADGREFIVACLHMPTARYAFGKLQRLDPSGMAPYIRWWGTEFLRMFALLSDLGDVPILVGGDFNNGPESSGLAVLRDSDQYRSAFDAAGWGWGYTRPSGFAWARIDHILANPAWIITKCWVGPSFGSDHKSVVADVSLTAGP